MQIYNKSKSANVNPHPKPNDEALQVLYKNMAGEIEFYNFVRFRFFQQLNKYGIKT